MDAGKLASLASSCVQADNLANLASGVDSDKLASLASDVDADKLASG